VDRKTTRREKSDSKHCHVAILSVVSERKANNETHRQRELSRTLMSALSPQATYPVIRKPVRLLTRMRLSVAWRRGSSARIAALELGMEAGPTSKS
jgi:hypothetical protein